MKKTLYLYGFLAITLLLMGNSGCDQVGSNSDKLLNKKQEVLMQEANRQVGMPNIVNFTQRKQLKMIQELCDQENLVCYAYIVAEMTGKLVFIGKCIGYGIPYSTEYTNPMKVISYGNNSSNYAGTEPATIPQADPNGLFMPANAEGTWIILIDPATNEPHPVYIEPRVIVSPFKLNIL